MRSLLFFAVFAGLVAGLFMLKFEQFDHAGSGDAQAASSGPPPTAVTVLHAAETTIDETMRTVGTIVAQRVVNVASSSPGVVTQLHFVSGQDVNEGDILVELDTRLEEARLKEAKAALSLAAKTLRRDLPLRAKGTVAQARLDADRAQVAMARARVQAVETEIELKRIRAPFSGRLGLRKIEVGAYLNPGTVISELVGQDGLYADLQVPQKSLAKLSPGVPVRLGAPGIQGTITATVKVVPPSIAIRSRSATVRTQVDKESAGHLKPGMFVTADIPVGTQRAIQLPSTAIVRSNRGDSVYVVVTDAERGDIAMSHPVVLGKAVGDLVTVTSGVKIDDKVITSGAFKLWEGASVVVDMRPNKARSATPELPNE